jgi:hypothetical protein
MAPEGSPHFETQSGLRHPAVAEIGDDLRAWGWSRAGEAITPDTVRGGTATRVDWLDAPV